MKTTAIQAGRRVFIAFLSSLLFWLSAAFAAPPVIDSISTSSQQRSGYLEVVGSGFGPSGTMTVDSFPAPVADWTDTRIVAYVPEAARLGPVQVYVTTASGPSNVLDLHVTERAAAGRIKWRLRMEGAYSLVRPARGPDGTIYAVDVRSRLYAVTPGGALKWIVPNAGAKGVSVGRDGTIYTGSENDVKAFAPDGTLKWTFVQNPRAFILIGLEVGPDGNIYGVASSGMGVFSLRPDGTERWRTPEPYDRLNVTYAEIAFGANHGTRQLYFGANNHVRAVRLDDGASVFTLGGAAQPVVSPFDSSVHFTERAYSPDGQLLWTFTFPVSGVPVSTPALGADGTHYTVNRMFELYALALNGTAKWNLTLPNYVGRPNVDPTNSLVVLGSGNTLNVRSFILGVSTASRSIAWQVELAPEEPTVFNSWTGQYGFNHGVDGLGRFTDDGGTVYIATYIAGGGVVKDRSFLYAIDTGSRATTPAPSPTPALIPMRLTDIALSARERRGTVTVDATVNARDTKNVAISGAKVSVSWILPNGTVQNQSVTTDARGNAKTTITGGRGSYTITVRDVVKTGYALDRTGSVLSRSISR
jgi:hypothetical protein